MTTEDLVDLIKDSLIDKLINPAVEKEINEEEKKEQERLRERELSDARKVLSTAEGRRFVYKILSYAKVYSTGYTGDNDTFKNAGMRQVGLFVMDEIEKANPGVYAQMCNEFRCEEKTIQARKAKGKK